MPSAALPASPAAAAPAMTAKVTIGSRSPRHVPDGAVDPRGAPAGQAEDERVLPGVVDGRRRDVEREAAGEAGQRAGERAGADGDRGDEQQDQVARRRPAAAAG